MKIWCQLVEKKSRTDPRFVNYYRFLEKHFISTQRQDTEVAIKDVPTGYGMIYYSSLRLLNDVEVLKSVLSAEKEGFDAAFIACFFDPIVHEARQLLKIPVTGLAESSMHLACMMGRQFAIITADARFIPQMEENIIKYGLESRVIRRNPVRTLTIPDEEMSKINEAIYKGVPANYIPLVENFKEIANGCVEDGAEALIAGCAGVSPFLTHAGLNEVDGAVVIDPLIASLKIAELLVDLNKANLPFISRKLKYSSPSSKAVAEVLAPNF